MSTEVAETILQQLGGRRFIAMTGAYHFVADSDALRFRLPPNFATSGINAVTITLNCMDTYDLVFAKVAALDVTEIATARDIYCDQLRDVFRSETGLDVVL